MQATEIQEAPTTKETEQQEKEAASRSYSFTCESGSAKSTKSPKLVIPPPGIQIYFMRYGLVKETLTTHPYQFNKGKITWQKPKGAPEIKGFKYGRTRLRKGWIYIYKEDKKTLQKTEVDRLDLNSSFTLFKDKTIWVCYNEIAWEKEYENLIINDSQLRNERMQKITFADWWHKQSHEDGCHVEDVDGIFQDSVDLYAFKNRHESVKANDNDPKRKEYMFFCLHDHLDVANQLYNHLLNQWNRMDTLLVSIKTGISQKEVYNAFKSKINPETLQPRYEQVMYLINTACLIKNLAFANAKAIEDIGQYVDKQRLETILAKKERNIQRNNIQEARLLLIAYLDSPYYAIPNPVKMKGKPLEFSKLINIEMLQLVSRMPNYKDAFMDEASDNNNWDITRDQPKSFVFKALSGQNHVGEIFSETTTIGSVESNSGLLKFTGIADGLIELGHSVSHVGPKILSVIVNVVNTLKIRINGSWINVFKEKPLKANVSDVSSPVSEDVLEMVNLNPEVIKRIKEAKVENPLEVESFLEVNQLVLTPQMEQSIKKSSFFQKLKNMKEGVRWNKLIRGVSGLNLIFTIAAARNNNHKYQFTLNALKICNAIFDLYNTQHNFRLNKLLISGDDVAINALKRSYVVNTKLVQYASVLIDTAEAGMNFWERDYDAAAAYGGSAALAALSIFALANSWNPIGWTLAIAAGGLSFYAAFLEDGPLEYYIKNSIFGIIPTSFHLSLLRFTPDIKFKGNYILQINQHVDPAVQDLLLKEGFKEWSDYKEGYKSLLDVLYAGRVVLNEKKSKTIEDVKPFLTTTSIRVNQITIMSAEIIFGEHIDNLEQFEYYIYYCPYGVGKKDYKEIEFDKKNLNVKIVNTPNEPGKILCDLHLPDFCANYKFNHAEILFLAKLKLNEQFNLPMDFEGKKRYISSSLKIFPTTVATDSSYTYTTYKTLKVDTIQNTLNGTHNH